MYNAIITPYYTEDGVLEIKLDSELGNLDIYYTFDKMCIRDSPKAVIQDVFPYHSSITSKTGRFCHTIENQHITFYYF